MEFLEIKSLRKNLGGRQVLDGLDLSVKRGSITVILGRSGCGKSVLLRHILGLIQPDSGEIWLDGIELTGLDEKAMDEQRRRIGMVFQGGALFDSMTVRENIAFGLSRRDDWVPEAVDARVDELLRMVDLSGISEQYPAEISGGMKKRVAVLRAIALEPELVLFDEPTTGLDPVMVRVIDSMTRRMVLSLNATAVVVTHDLPSAFRIADYMAFHHDGKIICYGSPSQFSSSDVRELRKFLAGEGI